MEEGDGRRKGDSLKRQNVDLCMLALDADQLVLVVGVGLVERGGCSVETNPELVVGPVVGNKENTGGEDAEQVPEEHQKELPSVEAEIKLNVLVCQVDGLTRF